MSKKYKSLDLTKLTCKKLNIISLKEALFDAIPIKWCKEGLSGKKKVHLNILNNKKGEEND